jgi:uncharacterized protein YkwD
VFADAPSGTGAPSGETAAADVPADPAVGGVERPAPAATTVAATPPADPPVATSEPATTSTDEVTPQQATAPATTAPATTAPATTAAAADDASTTEAVTDAVTDEVPGTAADAVVETGTESSAAGAPTPAAETAGPATAGPATAGPATAGPATASPGVEGEVLTLVNQERAAAGCPALRADPGLAGVARAHSADMRDRHFFSHVNPDGLDPFARARAAGITTARAENIAYGQPDAEAVMAAWMASPGHRENILDCGLATLGVGVAQGAGGPWWTQLFGA